MGPTAEQTLALKLIQVQTQERIMGPTAEQIPTVKQIQIQGRIPTLERMKTQ